MESFSPWMLDFMTGLYSKDEKEDFFVDLIFIMWRYCLFKYVIFHGMNKNIQMMNTNLEINGIQLLERVQSFNFLALVLNEHMSCKPHIDTFANKSAKCEGVLKKLKHFLFINTLITLYFRMVQSRLIYCIVTWGFDYYRIGNLQKRFVRIISLGTYYAHSEHPFKCLIS